MNSTGYNHGIHADLAQQHHDQHAGTEALLKKLARSYKTVQAEDKGAALAREKDALKARLGKHAVAPSFGAQGALGLQPASAPFRHLTVEMPPSPSPSASQPPPSAPGSSRSLYPAAPAESSARSLMSQASGTPPVAPAGLSTAAAAALQRLRDQQHKLQHQHWQQPQQQAGQAPLGGAYAGLPQAAYAQVPLAHPQNHPHQVQYLHQQQQQQQQCQQYGRGRYEGATPAAPQSGSTGSGVGGQAADECSAGPGLDTTAAGAGAADAGACKSAGASGASKFGKALKALLKPSKSKKGGAGEVLQVATGPDAVVADSALQTLRDAASGAGRYVPGTGGRQLQHPMAMADQHSLRATRDNPYAAPTPADSTRTLHPQQRHQLWGATGGKATTGAVPAPADPHQQQRQPPAPPQQQRHQLWAGQPGAQGKGRPPTAAATDSVSTAAYFQSGMPAQYAVPLLGSYPADPFAAPSLDGGANAPPAFPWSGASADSGVLAAPLLASAPLAAAGHAGGVATTLPFAYLQAPPPPQPQVAAKWQRLAVGGATAAGSSGRQAGAATGGISTAEVEAAVRGSDLAFGRHGSSGIDLFAPGTLAMLRRQQQQQQPQMPTPEGLTGVAAGHQIPASQAGTGAAAPLLPPGGARDAAAAAVSEVILSTTAAMQRPQDLPRGLGPAPPPLPSHGKKGAAGGAAADKEGGKSKHKVPSEAGNVWTALVHRSNIGQVAQRLAASVPGSRRPTDSSGVSGSMGGASAVPPANNGQPSSGGTSNSGAPAPSRRVSWGSDAGPGTASGGHEERASAPTAGAATRPRQLSGAGSTSANFRAAAAALSQLPPRPGGRSGSVTAASSAAAGTATTAQLQQHAPRPCIGAAASSEQPRAPQPGPGTTPGPSGAAPLQRYPAVPDGATAAARASALLAAQPAPAAGAPSPRAYPAVPGDAAATRAAATVPDTAYLLGILSRLKTPTVIRQAAGAAAAKAKAGTASASADAGPGIPQDHVPLAAAEYTDAPGSPAAAEAAAPAEAVDALEAAGAGGHTAVYRRAFGRSVGLAWRHKALGYSKAGATASFHERSLSHKQFSSGGGVRPVAADDSQELEAAASAAMAAEAVAAANALDSDAYEDAVEDEPSPQHSEGGADASPGGATGASPSAVRASRTRAPPTPGSPPPQPLLQPHEAVQLAARDEHGRVVALAAAWDDYVTPRSGCGPGPASAAASPSPAYRQPAASPPAAVSTAASPAPQQAQQLAHAAAMWLGQSPRGAQGPSPQTSAVTAATPPKPPAGPETLDMRRTPDRKLDYSGAEVASLSACAAAGTVAVSRVAASPLSSAAAAAAASGLRSRYATATQDDGCGSSDPEEVEPTAGSGSADEEQEYCAAEGEGEVEAPDSRVSGSSSVGSTRDRARTGMTPGGAAGSGHAVPDLALGLATAASAARPDRDMQWQQQRMNQSLFGAPASHSPHEMAAGITPGAALHVARSPAFRTPLRRWAEGDATDEEVDGGDTSSVAFASAATTAAAASAVMQSRELLPEMSLARQLQFRTAGLSAHTPEPHANVTADGVLPVQQPQQQPELSEAVAIWGAVPSAPPLLTPGVCQQLPPCAAAAAEGTPSFAVFMEGAQGATWPQSAAATPQLSLQVQQPLEGMPEATAAFSTPATASPLERHWCRRSVGVAAAVHRQQSQRAFRTPASSCGGDASAGGSRDAIQTQLEERAAAVIQARWRGIRSQRASLSGAAAQRLPVAACTPSLQAAGVPQGSSAGYADYLREGDDDAALSEAATDSGFEDADAAEELGVLIAQERLHTAAVLIQSAWRGHAARSATAEVRRRQCQAELLAAAEAARQQEQELREAEAAAEELRKMETAAVVVQAAWRGRLARACAQQERQQARALQQQRAEAAVLRVQAAWRGLVTRRRVERLRAAAAAARVAEEEARLRLEEEAAEQARQEAAATRVQAAWRGSRARATFVALQQERRAAEAAATAAAEQAQREDAAAVTMQAAWRGFRDRAAASRLHQQQRQREQELARQRQQDEEQAQLRAAATAVQAAWRGSRVRAEVQRLREQHQQEEAERREQQRQLAAAVRLQAAWRGHSARTAVAVERSRLVAAMAETAEAEAARQQQQEAEVEAAAELEAQAKVLRMNFAASRIQRAWSRRRSVLPLQPQLEDDEEFASTPAGATEPGSKEGQGALEKEEKEQSESGADRPAARASSARHGGHAAMCGNIFAVLAGDDDDDGDDEEEEDNEQDCAGEEAWLGSAAAASYRAEGKDAAGPSQLRAAPLSFDDIPLGVRLPVPPTAAATARRGPADCVPPAGPAGEGGLFVAVPVRSTEVAGLAAAGTTPRGRGPGCSDADPASAAAAAAGGKVAMLISEGISIRFPAVSPGSVQPPAAALQPTQQQLPAQLQHAAAFSDDDSADDDAPARPRAPLHALSPQRAAFTLPSALLSSSEGDDEEDEDEGGEADEEQQLSGEEGVGAGDDDDDGLVGGAAAGNEKEAVDEEMEAQVAALAQVAAAAAAGLLAGDDPRVLLLGQVLEDPSPQAEWLRGQIAEHMAATAAAEDQAAEAEAAATAAVLRAVTAARAGMEPTAQQESVNVSDSEVDEEADEDEDEGGSPAGLRSAANPFALLGGDDSGADEDEDEDEEDLSDGADSEQVASPPQMQQRLTATAAEGSQPRCSPIWAPAAPQRTGGGAAHADSGDESGESSPGGPSALRRPANPFALLGEGSEGEEEEDEEDEEGESGVGEDENDEHDQFSLDADSDDLSPEVPASPSPPVAEPAANFMAAAAGGATAAAPAAEATNNSPFSFGFGGGGVFGAAQSSWLGVGGGTSGQSAPWAIGAVPPPAGGGGAGPATPTLTTAWPAPAARAGNAAPGFGGFSLGQVWGAGGATAAATLFGNSSQQPTHAGGGLFGGASAVAAPAPAPGGHTAAASSDASYSAFASAVGTEAAMLPSGMGGAAALGPAALAAAATPMSRPRLWAQESDSPDGGYGGGRQPHIAAAADDPDAVSDASLPFLPYDSCTTTVAYNVPQRHGAGDPGGSFAGRLAAAWGAVPEEGGDGGVDGEGPEEGEEGAAPRHHGDRYRATSSPSVNNANTETPWRTGAGASGQVAAADASRAGAWDSPATAFQRAAPHTLRGVPTTIRAWAAAGGVEQTPCSARVMPSALARMQQQQQQQQQQWGPSLGPPFAATEPDSSSPGEDEDAEDADTPVEGTDGGELGPDALAGGTAARPARRGQEQQLFAAGAAMLPSRLFGEDEGEEGMELDGMSELEDEDEGEQAGEGGGEGEGGTSDEFEDAASHRAGACSSRGGSGFASACSSRRVSDGNGVVAPHLAGGATGLAAAWSVLGARGASSLGVMDPGLLPLGPQQQLQAQPGQRPSLW